MYTERMDQTTGRMDQTTGAPDRVGMEGIVSYADQVDAAAHDVESAWDYFQNGSNGRSSSSDSTSPPRSNDKLEATQSTLREAVNLLARIAQDIRSRA